MNSKFYCLSFLPEDGVNRMLVEGTSSSTHLRSRNPAPSKPTAVDGASIEGEGEDWAGRHLTSRDGVEQLRLSQPAPSLDQIGSKEGERHVTAPEQHRTDFEEEEK
jgi:hypothetical protein